MGILSWLIFGLIAGAVAKMLSPGKDPVGWLITIAIGIVGSMVGGFIGSTLLGMEINSGFNFKSFALAIGGAVLVLFIYNKFIK